MKNEKVFVKLLFSFSMFALSFVFLGNVQNAKANPNDCADAGGVCSSTNNCIGVAGSTGVQISDVWCDWGTTQTSACCVSSAVKTCEAAEGTCVEVGVCTGTQTADTCSVFGQVCCISGSSSSTSVCETLVDGVCEVGMCTSGTQTSDSCNDAGEVCCVGSSTTDGSGDATTGVADCPAGSICFASPLAFTTVEGVLSSILGTLQGIIVLISIVFIVIGAVMYITSAGNDKQIGMAKSAITASMIGLAIGIAAPSFLREISTILGWGATDACSGITDPAALQICQDTYNNSPTLAQIATNVLNFLLAIVGVLGIIMLVIGGATYLTSAGSDKKIDTAKAITKWAIVGIAVALAAMVLVKQIARFFV